MFPAFNIVFDERFDKRLVPFLTREQAVKLGYDYYENEEIPWNEPIVWDKENILQQLREDVRLGFHYGLKKREIMSEFLADVVCYWNYILEDGLEEFSDRGFYGLKLFKTTAEKYNFPNPIGNDTGEEIKYFA
jgi:hypothetical protein